jgi:hypothetical protein
MARIGFNARLGTAGGRWQVRYSPIVSQPGSPSPGGGLGFWWVHEAAAKDGPFPPYRFRVQRDAVMWAAMMNVRAP